MTRAITDGSWLTQSRIRAVALLCAATTLLCLAWLFATSHGTLDAWGRPLGTDFSDVWTAGRLEPRYLGCYVPAPAHISPDNHPLFPHPPGA